MKSLKLGMIGLDTSHCDSFTELLNNEENEHHVGGGRVCIAYPGGSRNFSKSISRVEGFTGKLRDNYGVRIAGTIEEVAEASDALFLESVDGRQHLNQFEKLAPFGKPVFVDKPFATSLEDARGIIELSEKHNAPVFSCSAIRYASGIADLGTGAVSGCEAYGPVAILDDYPGYFWYGIHCAEVLFSKMGTGCVEVCVHRAETADIITGRWEDGRMGCIYGYRIEGLGSFGCTIYGQQGVETAKASGTPPYYALMLPEVIEFFNSGVSPVSAAEMLEITAFLEAANESRERCERILLGN